MRYVPLSALNTEMGSLMPVLIEAIKLPLDESSLHLSVVRTFTVLLKDSPEKVGEHLVSLLPRLLDFAGDSKQAPIVHNSTSFLFSGTSNGIVEAFNSPFHSPIPSHSALQGDGIKAR